MLELEFVSINRASMLIKCDSGAARDSEYLNREFDASPLSPPDRVWCGHVTSVGVQGK